ncbi:hypothetical protein PABG_01343 [Paracoccidioides brasiliensis Pb03]|nr:hypothetical protein PABG_01343 [Paracoccidioides brasiliensis Pb03]
MDINSLPFPSEKGTTHHNSESVSLITSVRKNGPRHSKGTVCIFAIFLALFYRFIVLPRSVILGKWSSQTNGTQLQVFQLYKPLPGGPPNKDPSEGCNRELLLMKHEFGFSYGHPFVGNYVPPKCDFDTVIMNLTVTSKGRQFDRLALMFLGDTEVFRTSTAEPTPNGIVWTYLKDVSLYKALWMEPQKLIFDLGNLIDETYTGPFNVSLTAAFSLRNRDIRTADVILPISAQRSEVDLPSAFNLPDSNASVIHSIPDDAYRAVVSISACGQSTEEFWYTNVLSSDTYTFNQTTGPLYGYSPFREVQLLIDGQLAGVVWPFPIIFTGGIAPGFWRPIVGIDAFDLREPEIDITPFLPVLAGGQPHSFRLNVVGLGDIKDGVAELSPQVGSYWVVTGKIFIYLDEESASKRSMISPQDNSIPVVSTQMKSNIMHEWTQNPRTGANETLSYTVQVYRSLSVISPSSSWTQNLTFSNSGSFSKQGRAQLSKQRTDATSKSLDSSYGSDIIVSETASSYPLEVHSIYWSTTSGLEIQASLSRCLKFTYQTDLDYYSPYTLTTGSSQYDATQFGEATYKSMHGRSWSTGNTTEIFKESSGGTTYGVRARAINGTVIDARTQSTLSSRPPGQESSPGRDSVRAMLGRGPGRIKP